MKTPSPDLAGKLLDVTEEALRTDPPPRLEDIARLVGVSRATLYYYFSGRDDLLGFLLTAHAEAGARAVAAAAADHRDPLPKLRASVTAMAAYLSGNPGVCSGLLAAFGDAGRMSDVLRANDTWILDPLRALLTEGRTAGVFTFHDPDDTANAIVGAIMIAVLGRSMSGQNTTDPEFHRHLADQTVKGILA